MTTLRLLGFSGEVPRVIPRLLGDSSAQDAFNTRLDDGGLTPVRDSRHVKHLSEDDGYPAQIGTIYKHGEDWLAWSGHVYAVPGPVAQDRLYIFGDGAPRIRVEGQEYPLAVERPAFPLIATLNGSSSNPLVNTRMYVYTLVTDLGEETEPCPVSNSVDWRPGQTVTLAGFVDEAEGRTITHQRIYRSSTGTSGGTDFYLIAERAASTDNFTDNIAPENFMERLPSRTWNAPPDTLTGVISLPNGMMAGFSGKDLYFCEPHRPHAWPETYTLATDYEIVGLGAYETTIVVMTTGNPYLVTGTTPDSMIMRKMEYNLPCINARGIQDLGYTVVYPTNDGLATVSGGSVEVTTANLLTRVKWQSMFPKTMISGQQSGRYFSAYRYYDNNGQIHSGALIFDFSGLQPFIIRSRDVPDSYYYDIKTGSLYMLMGRDIYEYDAPGEPNTMQYWRSKEYILPKPGNFGAVLVEVIGLTEEQLEEFQARYEFYLNENKAILEWPSIGGEINGAPFNEVLVNGDYLYVLADYEFNGTVSVQIYADGNLVATVDKFNRMARLPSGFLARKWEVSVSSDVRIEQITLATTGAELMEV